MLKNDKRELKNLVGAYSLRDIVKSLGEIASERADEMSDMGLRTRAISWADDAALLKEMAEEITE